MENKTAVEWLEKELKDRYALMNSEPLFQQALEMEKQQKEKTVLIILNHVLQHDYTARWLAEKIEAGKINVNDL